MIPKKIHYCWFGKKPLPETALKCIISWKKFLPDWEIIEWNETNYDINKNIYISQAYEAKKYAFVSDYARFDILNKYGGLYFDVDVEIINDISFILENGAFLGFEKLGIVNPGLGMGSEKNSIFLKKVLDSYNNNLFFNPNGSYNELTIVTRTTDILKKYGLSENNEIQHIMDVSIYPIDYFCPKNPDTGIIKLTDKSVSIHHFDGSWLSPEMKLLYEEKYWLSKHIKIKVIRLICEKLCVLKKVIKEFFNKWK